MYLTIFAVNTSQIRCLEQIRNETFRNHNSNYKRYESHVFNRPK